MILSCFAGPGRAAAQAATPTAEAFLVAEARRIVDARHLDAAALPPLPTASRRPFIEALQAKDPYAQWHDPAIAQVIRNWNGARRFGLGVSLVDGESGGTVLVPLQNGPTQRRLFRNPAHLLAVNGVDTAAKPPEKVAALLAPGPRSSVILKVRELETGRVIEGTVPREWHQAATVEAVPTVVPMLRIHRFENGASRAELRAALKALAEHREPGAPLVIDLRYATGGSLIEALDCLGPFLPPGQPLVQLRDNTGRSTAFQSVRSDLQAPSPIIVLVDRQTASAAEVFAFALQHHGAARVVGRPTYGKCVAQSEFPLTDGSMLLFTTHALLYPGGNACSSTGISPDTLVATVHQTDEILRSLSGAVAALHPAAVPARVAVDPPHKPGAPLPAGARALLADHLVCQDDADDPIERERLASEILLSTNLTVEEIVTITETMRNAEPVVHLCLRPLRNQGAARAEADRLSSLLDRGFTAHRYIQPQRAVP